MAVPFFFYSGVLKMPRVSNAFEDYTSIKPLNKNKHNKFLLERNSINVHSKTLDHSSNCKMRTGWPYIGHFGVA